MTRIESRRGSIVLVVMVLATLAVRTQSADAVVTEVTGSACGYITNVGLFGGPQTLNGCGTSVAPTNPSFSPFVSLPAGGSGTALTASDPNGAVAQYGPARIYAGRWPCETPNGNCPLSAPPSGPMSVSTEGTPAGGTVTSSADTVLFEPPQPTVGCSTTETTATSCFAPGGVGPWPAEADEVHVDCTASESQITGTTTFVNAQLAHSVDLTTGGPADVENIPDNPPVNFTRSGIISNVGDVFTVVFNEQIINPDGSLTVNGMHMYLFGPVAVGEMIKGQATCGVTPSPLSPADDTTSPTCGEPTLVVDDPETPEPVVPQQVILGLFDPSGLQSVELTAQNNVTVQIGDPSSGQEYLRFTPGQTGPLVLRATRQDEAVATEWSFTATDAQGNVTQGTVTGTAGTTNPVLDVTCQGTGGGGTTTTTGGGGGTTTTGGSGNTTTTGGGGGNVTTTTARGGGGNTTTTARGGGGNTTTTTGTGGGGTGGGGTGGGGTSNTGGTGGGTGSGTGTGTLVRTGGDVLELIELAFALLLSGWAATLASRRREPRCLRPGDGRP